MLWTAKSLLHARRSLLHARRSLLQMDRRLCQSGIRLRRAGVRLAPEAHVGVTRRGRKGFIHMAISPAVGYVHQTLSTSGTDELAGSGAGVVTEFKFGAGFNGDRWYTALTTAFYYSTTPIAEHLNLSTNYGFVRFAVGIRLGDPGIKGLEKVGL